MVASLALLAGPLGCQELADIWNGAAEQTNEGRENRERAVQAEEAKRAYELERVVRKAPAKRALESESFGTFDSTSPAGRLKALLERRLECANDECRREVLETVRRDSALVLPGISELVTRQPEAITIEAVRLAGLFRHVASIEALGRAALVGSGRVRAEAVWALGETGDPRALEPLDRISRLDNPLDINSAICRAVGAIGRPEGAPILDRLYSAADPRTRGECVRAAGSIGSIEVMPLLRRAVDDADTSVRDDTRRALEKIPGKEPKRLIRKLGSR
ncbi:MAG: HEAT repeat domain-containing protein [Myxococcota bacterium]